MALNRNIARLVLALPLLACIPISVTWTATLRPDARIEVIDTDDHPVAGATVILRRLHMAPGPLFETDRWTGQTDADGVVRFTRIERQETTLPLMMHGVSFYGFEFCAEKDGQSKVDQVNFGRHDTEFRSVLRLSDGPCEFRELDPPTDLAADAVAPSSDHGGDRRTLATQSTGAVRVGAGRGVLVPDDARSSRPRGALDE